MNVNLPSDLHLQVRKIRNIEVWWSDLLPLILGRQQIPSTPINAFGVQLQDLDQGNRGYTIFSLWLGAFVSGYAHEGHAEGTFNDEHVKAAVSSACGASDRTILTSVAQYPTDTSEMLSCC